jgi:hypothetical protein
MICKLCKQEFATSDLLGEVNMCRTCILNLKFGPVDKPIIETTDTPGPILLIYRHSELIGSAQIKPGSNHDERARMCDRTRGWTHYGILHRRQPEFSNPWYEIEAMERDGNAWYHLNIFTGELSQKQLIPRPGQIEVDSK